MLNSSQQSLQTYACSIFSEISLDFNSWIADVFISVNVIFCITAVLGNTLILVALRKDFQVLHPPSKLLFRCLASTDLCVGLITQPSLVVQLLSVDKQLGPDICVATFLNISTSMLCGISLFTLTAISVDRLLALLLGLRYKQVVTLRRVRVISFLSWLVFSSLSMLYFLNKRTFLTIVSFNVLLFLLVSTLCYFKIYRSLRYREVQVQQYSGPGRPNLYNRARAFKYKGTVSTSLWVSISLLACYLPFAIVMTVKLVHQDLPFSALAELITVSLIYFNSSINPVIYCWRIREVRRAVKETIRHFWLLCF